VIENYADMLFAGYADAEALARELDAAITAFVAAPSADGLAAARNAWLEARPFYQETEVARFYEGPIDNASDGPEGQINAWPLDEGYIDYVEGSPGTGIINQPGAFPVISKETLAAANEVGGEANIATGWHAIEFLLWGQDLSAAGAGARSHLDYVDGGGTAPAGNEVRRREYLKAASELLVEDLAGVADAWDPAIPGNFREQFLALSTRDGLSKILTGIGTLTSGELRGERLLAAYVNKDQEDEHSCFSDNTHIDHLHDAIGIRNICQGRYERADGSMVQGTSLMDLLQELNQDALAADLSASLDASVQEINAIPEPFDQAILQNAGSPAGVQIEKAIAALAEQTNLLSQTAAVLKVPISTTLP
jgi:putative iron-regulated protein